MKRITTFLFALILFGSAYSQGNISINQKLEKFSNNNIVQQFKKAKKQQPRNKALIFDNAYYELEFDTTALSWDSIQRTTQYIDYNIIKINSVKFSQITEEYNGVSFIRKDSMIALLDTTNPFKNIIPEDYGLMDSITLFSYDSASAAWLLFFNNYSIITANRIVAQVSYLNLAALGIPGGGLILFGRVDFYYNSSNHLTHWVKKDLNFGLGIMQNSDSVAVTTNANGFRIIDEEYSWNGSSWEADNKIFYTYDANNNIKEQIEQDYNNNAFVNSNKDRFTYNAAGDILVDTSYSFVGASWVLYRIDINTYNSRGDDLTNSEYFTQNGVPYLFSKSDYYYNINHRRDSVVGQSRDFSPSTPLRFSEKKIYRYSPFPASGGGAATSPATPTNLTITPSQKTPSPTMLLAWTDNSNNELGFIIERSTNGTSWNSIGSTAIDAVTFTDTNVSSNTLYYYRIFAYNTVGSSSYSNTGSGTSLNVGIEEAQKNSFSVYPNPASSVLKIQENNSNKLFQLLDLNGRTIKTFKVNGYYELNLEALSNGIYFLKSNTEVIKVVKH